MNTNSSSPIAPEQSQVTPITVGHCHVSPKITLPRPIYLLGLQIPVAKTPCSIPLDDWPLCYADECYLNAHCPSYAGSHPRFEPRKPINTAKTRPVATDEWD